MKSAAYALFRALKWNTPATPNDLSVGMGKRHPSQACRWPGCDHVYSKSMGVGTKELVAVCPEHSRQFRKLDIAGYNNMPWQPMRPWK